MPRAALAIALLALAAPALAGCLASPAVQPAGLGLPLAGALLPGKPRCLDGPEGPACNYLMTVSPAERQGNEVTIAVNPLDPDNVVGGAKDYTPEHAGDCVWDGVYSTLDGGLTFVSDNVPGSPWKLLGDPGAFEPTPISQYWCATDPVVAFGPDGTFYYTLLAYQGDPVTGSKTGDGVIPRTPVNQGGGLNDWAFNRVSMAVAVSADGGRSFERITIIDSGSYPVNFHDRQWAEVGRNGQLYVAWTSIFAEGNMFYRSRDQGRSFDPPVFLNRVPLVVDPTGPSPRGLFVAAGPGDEVVVSGCTGQGPAIAVSKDAGSTFAPWAIAVEGSDEGMEATYRSGMVCMVAMDDGDGPFSGATYLVWSDTRNGHRDIFFARSADLGATWSEPAQLNTDGTDADQFFPAISVSPRGVVDVAWYDRSHGGNELLDLTHTYSLDGGATWAPPLRVTTRSSDPQYSHHQNGMVFIGDYIDMDSSDACAWPVWVDTSRSQKADVMTTCVERPSEPRAPPAA